MRAAWRLCQFRHLRHQRNVGEAHGAFLEHHGLHARSVFLLEPAQAPVALHGRLVVGIGSVGGFKVGHGGQQVGIFGLERRDQLGRHAMLRHRSDLPLIDQIDIAAQRRGAPRILRHAQTFMRRRIRLHARAVHTPGLLRAIDARHPSVGQHAAPRAVGQDHQFGDDLVQRRAAFALFDPHALAATIGLGNRIDVERIIALLRALGLQAAGNACLLAAVVQRAHKRPQHGQFGLERVVARAIGQRVGGDHVVEQVVAQVGRHGHGFAARLAGGDRPRGAVDRRVQRQRRACAPFLQRVTVNHRLRQHRDLVAGEIHGRQTLACNHVQRLATLDAEARRGNVNTDPHRGVINGRNGDGIVDFRGGHVIDRKGAHVGGRQLHRRFRHGHIREAGALREAFRKETRLMQRAGIGNAAHCHHQAHRRQAQRRARRIERLVFETVLVRLEQQLQRLAAEGLGQSHRLQLGFVFGLQSSLLLLALQACERGLQLVFRCALIAASALAAEVDRRAMQRDGQRRLLCGIGAGAKILAGQIGEAELVR